MFRCVSSDMCSTHRWVETCDGRDKLELKNRSPVSNQADSCLL